METKDKSIQLILQKLKEQNLPPLILRKQINHQLLDQKLTKEASISGTLLSQNLEEIQKLKDFSREISKEGFLKPKEHLILQKFQIYNHLRIGDKFPEIKDNFVDLNSGQLTHLVHQQNQILLIILWSSQQKSSYQQVQKAFSISNKYKDQLKIIDLKLQLPIHVGNLGKIHEKVGLKNVYLQNEISLSLKLTPQNYLTIGVDLQEDIQEYPKNVYQEVKKNLFQKEIQQEFFDLNLDYQPLFSISMVRYKVFDQQGNQIKKVYQKPVLKYAVRINDQEKFNNLLLKKILEKLPKNDLIEIEDTIIDTVDIKEGNQCHVCSNKLEKPYYFNYFLNNYVCLKCGDEKDISKKNIEQYKVPHNLILINTSNTEYLNNIDQDRLGKDIQPEVEQKFIFPSHAMIICNACKIHPKIRYICLNCLPGPFDKNKGYVDLCQDCAKKCHLNKDKYTLEKINMQGEKHNSEHLLLKVLYFHGKYNLY
ncbi:hypothetical protein IMG5_107350 [Ichthyophthirius multifiliis]|uniref:Uncharacterized protein n=1 Tax=Ichthyophthirius multifiliis TaxID=5932 RepID=G0QTD9_ICHMU|nr:hypothetical protein IMG5_107350 [Ichthyophthirius multifiliis]EGR31516.1 hypothetical protein IMG5_107350 [Ichthyophthirius multifiliis]|eukprot:XP_004035002.1 hypothetical protein IMG5_107350 [Ichthyophthirius multifiliis]